MPIRHRISDAFSACGRGFGRSGRQVVVKCFVYDVVNLEGGGTVSFVNHEKHTSTAELDRVSRTGRRLPSTAWSKGAPSPNPGGRPRELRTQANALAQALAVAVEDKREELIENLVRDAVAGNAQARELLFSRIMPAARSTFQAVPIPGLAEARTLKERVLSVQQAMAQGILSADHAATVIASLKDAEMALQVEALREQIEGLRAALTVDVQ